MFKRGTTMDAQQSTPQQENQQQIEQMKKIKKTDSKGKLFLIVLLVLVLIAGAAFAGWWYANNQAKDKLAAKDAEISALQTEKQNLEQQLSATQTSAKSTEESTGPSEETIENIQVAVKDKNYVALEDYVDGEITVILAASECCGARTFAQAAEDMKYLNSATAPWNFELDATTLEAYASGDYSEYFPEDALVGKSANNYVVSFSFDDSGNISTVFITNNASLL